MKKREAVVRKRRTGLLQTSWKAVSPGGVRFNSRPFIPGRQGVCRSSQGLVLSLEVLCESKSLFPGVWWLKSWLAVSDKVESFWIDEISMLQDGVLKVVISWGALWEDWATKAWLFLIEAIRPLQFWSSCPFKIKGQRRQGPSTLDVLWGSQRVTDYAFP